METTNVVDGGRVRAATWDAFRAAVAVILATFSRREELSAPVRSALDTAAQRLADRGDMSEPVANAWAVWLEASEDEARSVDVARAVERYLAEIALPFASARDDGGLAPDTMYGGSERRRAVREALREEMAPGRWDPDAIAAAARGERLPAEPVEYTEGKHVVDVALALPRREDPDAALEAVIVKNRAAPEDHPSPCTWEVIGDRCTCGGRS